MPRRKQDTAAGSDLAGVRAGFTLADGVAMLVGMGLCWSASGFAQQFYRVLDPTPTTWRLVWGAVFGALSAGPALPTALAVWVGAHVLGRRGDRHGSVLAPPRVDDIDLSLFWTVLAGLALVTGLLLAATPVLILLAQRAYARLLDTFVWIPASLTALEAAMVFACAVIPFLPAGWVLSCLHGLADPSVRWSVRPLAGVSVGTAVSGLVLATGPGGRLPASVLMVAGAIPFLVVSILAVRRSHAHDVDQELPTAEEPPSPAEKDLWPAVIRASVVCMTAAGAASACWWGRAFDVLGGPNGLRTLEVVSVALLAFGVGVWCASGWGRSRTVSVGGVGTIVAGAGLTLAAALGLVGLFPRYAAVDADGNHLFWLTVMVFLGVPSLITGYAITRGYDTVLCRVGSRPAVGASMLSASLAAVAVTTLFVVGPVVAAIGTYAAIAAAALVLVAVGGVLIIHEPSYTGASRHVRVACVFAAVAWMSVALPVPARSWLLTGPGTRVRLIESPWLTRSLWQTGDIQHLRAEPPPRKSVDGARFGWSSAAGPLLDLAEIRPDKRIAFVGQTSAGLESAIGFRATECEFHPFDPGAGDPSSLTGTRFLRLGRGQLDVLLLSLDGLSGPLQERLLAASTLERARNKLKPDGMAVVLLPLEALDAERLGRWIARVERLTDSQFVWTGLGGDGTKVLVLVFGRDGAWRERWSRWSRHPGRTPTELPKGSL